MLAFKLDGKPINSKIFRENIRLFCLNNFYLIKKTHLLRYSRHLSKCSFINSYVDLVKIS